MKKLFALGVVSVGLAALAAGCGDSAQDIGPQSAAGGSVPASAGASGAVGAGVAGVSAAGRPATGGSSATDMAGRPAAGGGGGSAAMAGSGDGSVPTSGASGSPSAGSGAEPSAAGGGAVMPMPAAVVTDPDLGGTVGLGSGGIGVNDLDKASEFFVTLVGMEVQTPMIEREDRYERVLRIGEPGMPTVTLMKYKDDRVIMGCPDVNECTAANVPSKLVFYMPSPGDAAEKIIAGGYESILNVGAIAQVTAVDGYMIEFLQGDPTFIAVAFGVTDLDKTTKFYTDAFGLESTGSYNDAAMSGLQEQFVANPDGGAAVVVQHYTMGEWNYKDNPVKTVWNVPDAAAALTKVVGLGATMVSPAAPLPAFNNRITAIAKDFDGYLIEMVQP
jgi:predicted enzyme related to lactoylglutathione lyase